VKGFALTLALGVMVSLFTAVFVSRTFLGIAVDFIKTDKIKNSFGL
jgi:preprotein translocase subunit SecD